MALKALDQSVANAASPAPQNAATSSAAGGAAPLQAAPSKPVAPTI
jgi:hypothetical protein